MRHQIDVEALRHELARRCLSQSEFAAAAGVSAATVSHVIHRGRAGDATLGKFARALVTIPANRGADVILRRPASAEPELPTADRGLELGA